MSIVDETMNLVANRDPNQPEFHQAVQEVVESLEPVLDRHSDLRAAKIVERLVEPERVIDNAFRSPEPVDHRIGIGPTRHPFWVDEGGDLNLF